MQQVKKQLQDAIAELKSGWGINEVKREDLAAVLEKVVAALDRAAQLPVVPTQPEYVGGVIRGVVIKEHEVDYETDTRASIGAVPAFLKKTSEGGFNLGFYDPGSRIFYKRSYKGLLPSDTISNCLIEHNGYLFFPYKQKVPGVYQINSIRTDDAIGI